MLDSGLKKTHAHAYQVSVSSCYLALGSLRSRLSTSQVPAQVRAPTVCAQGDAYANPL